MSDQSKWSDEWKPGRYGVALDSSYLGVERVGDYQLNFFPMLTQEASKEAERSVSFHSILRVSLRHSAV
ncbi:MAG: hypothetical protein Roseis2KO_48250 [Roseivirga sp.]